MSFENMMILVCQVESYFEWPTRFKDRIEIQFICTKVYSGFDFVCRKKKRRFQSKHAITKLILRFRLI